MSTNSPTVAYDITRLATRFSRSTPNGIDRVDIAYAGHFFAEQRGGLGAVLGPTGLRVVDTPAAFALVEAIAKHWRELDEADAGADADEARLAAIIAKDSTATSSGRDRAHSEPSGLGSAIRFIASGKALGRRGLVPGRSLEHVLPPGSMYLNFSQFPLWLDWYFRWLDRRPDVKAVFFVHDLLPIEYPEFFPASEAARHARRIDVLARRASGIVVAGEHTRLGLLKAIAERGRKPPPVLVAPLGVAPWFTPTPRHTESLRLQNYFLTVGTFEPRKNHLLLLNIWRELAAQANGPPPTLVMAGAAGWDCENVVDMIERCDAIRPFVVQAKGLSSAMLSRLMAGARAVLMPTFDEGFGLPVAEALATRTRVFASSIPAFHRFKHDPQLTLLDPLDGVAWQNAIVDCISAPRPISGSIAGAGRHTDPWPYCHVEAFLRSL